MHASAEYVGSVNADLNALKFRKFGDKIKII